ncbi:Dihydrofolate reductase [Lachnellula subtilissima]|uniref:Dihydrofolate reductase n=1 Tax=Lachnellula subtilissima TaxID=602034 RepID=A0A8H8UF47_9HELO|nr:Dihydrofolate reductase [Lachnellula subtilissima]
MPNNNTTASPCRLVLSLILQNTRPNYYKRQIAPFVTVSKMPGKEKWRAGTEEVEDINASWSVTPPPPPLPRASSPLITLLTFHQGYTQSGSLFHGKTRALEKILIKAFPPPPPPPHNKKAAFFRILRSEEARDAYGWWTKNDSTDEYTGLEKGLATIRDAIQNANGIDGVIGFSQGGAAAALVASLLEPNRPAAFAAHSASYPDANALAFPAGWAELQKEFGPLKFAVSYSGFYAPGDRYAAFYEPKIHTKVLNVIGSLDSVVGEDRSRGLVERCVGGEERVVMHPGGHFVPVGKEMAGVVVGFIRGCLEGEKKEEESAEDMDVPF